MLSWIFDQTNASNDKELANRCVTTGELPFAKELTGWQVTGQLGVQTRELIYRD